MFSPFFTHIRVRPKAVLHFVQGRFFNFLPNVLLFVNSRLFWLQDKNNGQNI